MPTEDGRASDYLELELQVIGSHLAQMLRTVLRSSSRAVHRLPTTEPCFQKNEVVLKPSNYQTYVNLLSLIQTKYIAIKTCLRKFMDS